jgi:hypothetical protein
MGQHEEHHTVTDEVNNHETTLPAKNRGGRPFGSKNKSKQLLDAIMADDPEAPKEIAKTIVTAAKAGKSWACELVANRLWPAPKQRTVAFELPPLNTAADLRDAMNAVLQAVAAGILSFDEGEQMCSMLNNYAEPVIEHADLEQEIKGAQAA